MEITRTDTKPQMAYEYQKLIIELKPCKGKPSSYQMFVVLRNDKKEDDVFKQMVERIKQKGILNRRTITGWYIYHKEYIKL